MEKCSQGDSAATVEMTASQTVEVIQKMQHIDFHLCALAGLLQGRGQARSELHGEILRMEHEMEALLARWQPAKFI